MTTPQKLSDEELAGAIGRVRAWNEHKVPVVNFCDIKIVLDQLTAMRERLTLRELMNGPITVGLAGYPVDLEAYPMMKEDIAKAIIAHVTQGEK